ncbi:MAG: winged helix-turn-helix transcriptional regulator [Alphaproteobacteria bacterium]|nr:MAG: winged helix-turn-helix transcriptional regulator [Alphaproteobacteria bacterium]
MPKLGNTRVPVCCAAPGKRRCGAPTLPLPAYAGNAGPWTRPRKFRRRRRSPAPACACAKPRGASGLTITQFGLLAHLRVLDGIGVGALAEKLVMDPTTLTRNLRPLQRRGFVVLAPDPDDRRSRSLHLTEQGREALRAARPAWARAQRHVEEVLGNADAAVLNSALDRVLERLA